MPNRDAPLNTRTISFLFRNVFKSDRVKVKRVNGLFFAYFNDEAEPRHSGESLTALWDAVLDHRIQTKLHEHANS
jgi:hypothetical protein